MDTWHLLLDIVVLLTTCLVLGGISSRLGQSPIIGYLLAGMFLGGPGSFGIVRSEAEIDALAEIGVSLLLFGIGLEFSWRRLKSFGGKALSTGALQVLVTLGLVALVAWFFGLPLPAAFAVGTMVCLSSTACVLRVLTESAEMDSAVGRNALVILLVQDIAVVPLAVFMTLLGGALTPASVFIQVFRTGLLAASLVVGLFLLLSVVAVRFLGTLTLLKNRELTVLLAVVTGLGAAWAAHRAQLSPALGAFIAGMLLGSSPFATQIHADISSIRVLLLTLFFGAAGMVADPVWIFWNLGTVIGVSAALILGKTLVVWGILSFLGQPHQIGLATGLAVSQIGEFAFVLGTLGQESGVVTDETHLPIVSAAIVTLFVTPYLVTFGPRISTWILASLLRKGGGLPGSQPSPSPTVTDVLVVGFGPAGRVAAQILIGRGLEVLVLDLNHESVKRAEELGFRGKVGDATQMDVLEHADVRSANLVIVTVPNRTTALTVLHHIGRLAPQAHVVVRSRHQRHSHEFEDAGAHAVIGDEEVVGKSLAAHVSEFLHAEGTIS